MRKLLAAALLFGVCAVAVPSAHAQPPDATDARPGCTWARLHPTNGRATGAWGAADLPAGRLNDAGTIFNIASVSKQFTALAVLLLAYDGQLDLDEALSLYLPQLPGELGTPTLRQMLRHTSGLPDYISPLFDAGRQDQPVTAAETMDIIVRQPHLTFPPGSRFEYSNTGYFLLAQVVERLSGLPLAAFSRQYIFQPLGLRDTSIVDHYPSGISVLAHGYEAQDGQSIPSESRWEQTGDGQVHTNARDMLRWLRHLDNDTPLTTPGGLHTPGVQTLLTDGAAPVVGSPRDSYYHGLEAVRLDGEAMWAHAGGWAGYRSFMVYAPASHRGAAVMCNTTDIDVETVAEAIMTEKLMGDLAGYRR